MCPKSAFGYLSIMITPNKIELLSYPSCCSASDLNKSATGTEAPPLHLMKAIVRPQKIFPEQGGCFQPCADGLHSNWEMGGAVGDDDSEEMN